MLFASTAMIATAKIDYATDVQPILSNYCYACHGPDTAGRKAKLRLDLRDAALNHTGDDGAKVIVPGDPDGSDLVRRIESLNPDAVMPQDPDKQLSKAQIAILREWVREGAEFRDHWAFEPPKKAPLPTVADTDWCETEIDRFVLARIEAAGRKPSPEASRRELIRRATLDLTGLWPTPSDVDAFLQDPAPDAYEKVLDRLLASPRYGEHRARYWMDYARYGDTQGLHADAHQSRWPYRDYVIRAFDDDIPYDQFTIEQLAGDLLPPTRVDELVATGLIRCGIATGEGGTIIEELRAALARERAEMYGSVYLGLTTGCAACHDHKYDPLTQRDFYGLTAFFNNIAEKASCDDRVDWPPNIHVPTAANREAYNAVLRKKADIQTQLASRRAQAPALIAEWLAQGGPEPVAPAGLELRLRLDQDPDHPKRIHNSAPNADSAPFRTEGPAPQWGEETMLWPSFRLETNTRLDLGQAADFAKDEAFTVGAWMKPRNVPGGKSWNTKSGALIARMDLAQKLRGWELYYEADDALTVQLISSHPTDMIAVTTVGTTETRDPFRLHEGHHGGTPRNITLPRGNWRHVCFTYDGSGKAAGIRIYVNGLPQKLKVVKDSLTGSIRSQAPLTLGRRHDGNPMQGTAYQDLRIYRRSLSAAEVGRLMREDVAAEIVAAGPAASWSTDQRKIVEDAYFLQVDPVSRELRKQLPALNAELLHLQNGGSLTLVCREKDSLPYAHILDRGLFNARGERLGPAVPHFLPDLPADASRNRLGLAQWTVSPENPLTARVTVNRIWQEIFGHGLSPTTGDLGVVGEPPSHPLLLDWLAVDFRDNGWGVKRLYKRLLMSATYRQTANSSPAAVAQDPQNRLLARGPRFRADAEVLRDTALQASGLLVEKIGGPSVKPYQPVGIWDGTYGGKVRYPQDHGPNLYRRSLYTYLKRMAPPPNMEAFDATDRANVCVRRQRTNTPLAALVLMNDPQLLEAARHLGRRAMSAPTDQARIDFLASTVLARRFTDSERQALLEALQKFRDDLGADSERAAALLSVGESPREHTPSLTTGKPATASDHMRGNVPGIANDGVIDTNRYWEMDAATGKPVWWQVDLQTATEVGCVIVIGYYGDTRHYGFSVETSLDGQTWDMVADYRDNTEPSTGDGYTCRFEPRPVRYIRVNQPHNSANSGRHLVEVLAYARDPARVAGSPLIEEAVWMLMASTVLNCDDALNK
jgi:hypothetical protein